MDNEAKEQETSTIVTDRNRLTLNPCEEKTRVGECISGQLRIERHHSFRGKHGCRLLSALGLEFVLLQVTRSNFRGSVKKLHHIHKIFGQRDGEGNQANQLKQANVSSIELEG